MQLRHETVFDFDDYWASFTKKTREKFLRNTLRIRRDDEENGYLDDQFEDMVRNTAIKGIVLVNLYNGTIHFENNDDMLLFKTTYHGTIIS